jgi:hypothetical protein
VGGRVMGAGAGAGAGVRVGAGVDVGTSAGAGAGARRAADTPVVLDATAGGTASDTCTFPRSPISRTTLSSLLSKEASSSFSASHIAYLHNIIIMQTKHLSIKKVSPNLNQKSASES